MFNITNIVELLSKLQDEPCVKIKIDKSAPQTLQINPSFMEILKNHITISDATLLEIQVVQFNEAPPNFEDPANNALDTFEAVISESTDSIQFSTSSNTAEVDKSSKSYDIESLRSRKIKPDVHPIRCVSPDTIKYFTGQDVRETLEYRLSEINLASNADNQIVFVSISINVDWEDG